jgi:hypothetical protein
LAAVVATLVVGVVLVEAAAGRAFGATSPTTTENVPGPQNDGSDFFGILLALAAILLAIFVTRRVFGSGSGRGRGVRPRGPTRGRSVVPTSGRPLDNVAPSPGLPAQSLPAQQAPPQPPPE